MTRAAKRRALGFASAVLVGMGVGVAPVAAEEPAALGWWWIGRPSSTLPALFSPVTTVPEGGMYVAGDATGPTGISALRFELDRDASATALTLTIADVAGTPIIEACTSSERWEPAENGGWDQRPEPDCEVSIAGTVDADESEITFPLIELQDQGGVVDLVFVPGVDPETQDPAAFSVAFEPPGEDALVVDEPAGTADTAAPASPPPPPLGTPALPSFVAPALPLMRAPTIDEPAEPEIAAPRTQPATPALLASGLPGADSFAYPAVLALPLVLLAGSSYFAWTLTRPVIVRRVQQG